MCIDMCTDLCVELCTDMYTDMYIILWLQLWLNSTREEVTFCRLAFEDHCELCDAVQRRHGIAGEVGHGLLDSGSRKDRNAVGWLGTR